MHFAENADLGGDGTRYGRFAIAPRLPGWEVYAFRGDLHRWQYTGLWFVRKLTAMRVAQAMFLAENQHWGPEKVQ